MKTYAIRGIYSKYFQVKLESVKIREISVQNIISKGEPLKHIASELQYHQPESA